MVGEISVEETSGRRIAPLGKCKSAICPRRSVSRETVPQSVNFKNTLGNFLRKCVSIIVLFVDGFVQGAQQKELILASFAKHFKVATLRRSH